jgi:hypothetical protein
MALQDLAQHVDALLEGPLGSRAVQNSQPIVRAVQRIG